jgi:hypothetical protein
MHDRHTHPRKRRRGEVVRIDAPSDRIASTTRYYLARRIGGAPAAMGWEPQAVHLVPLKLLKRFSHENDRAVVDAITQRQLRPMSRPNRPLNSQSD